MSGTELEEVQALLEHVLPDPAGYAQRVALQFMTRWGESAGTNTSAFAPAAPGDEAAAGFTIAPDWLTGDEAPIDTSMLLAAALGACECWGLRANCDACQGRGSAGWTQPDPELFEEFVKPAIAKLSRISANGHEQYGVNDLQDSRHHQTAQGVNL